jgi:hypothetical protein
MNRLSTTAWEAAALVAGVAIAGAGAFWFARRKRPTPEELELARRRLLVESGRIVDGMLLDTYEIDSAGRRLTMLLFAYRIGGVDYECSQDITALTGSFDITRFRAGFPCSVRYQPGNPQNSIVLAEGWSGIRMGLPGQNRDEDAELIGTSSPRASASPAHTRP